MYKLSREKDYSWYQTEVRKVLVCPLYLFHTDASP